MTAMDAPRVAYVPALRREVVCAHLVADTLDELHAAAQRLGLKRAWFQGGNMPHYDLMGSKVVAARQVYPVVESRQMLEMARQCGRSE